MAVRLSVSLDTERVVDGITGGTEVSDPFSLNQGIAGTAVSRQRPPFRDFMP